MSKLLYLSTLATLSLIGCRHDSDSPAPAEGLAGTWRLTNMACYCAYDPKLVEVLTLESNLQFRLVRDGRLAAEGTYFLTQGSACAGGPAAPYLQLNVSTPGTYAPFGVYKVQQNTLTIERCVALDGPSYTYQRQ